MEKYINVSDGDEFVKDELSKLSQRKRQLSDDIDATEIIINDIETKSVDKNFVGQILSSFDDIYSNDLKPYQRRELLYSTLTKIEFSDKVLKVGMPLEKANGTSSGSTDLMSVTTSLPRARMLNIRTLRIYFDIWEIKTSILSPVLTAPERLHLRRNSFRITPNARILSMLT
jgi:hypothetical protein